MIIGLDDRSLSSWWQWSTMPLSISMPLSCLQPSAACCCWSNARHREPAVSSNISFPNRLLVGQSPAVPADGQVHLMNPPAVGDQDQDLVNVLGTVTQPVAALRSQLCKISGCRSRVGVMSVLENNTTDPKWSQNVIQSASESWVLGFGNRNSWLWKEPLCNNGPARRWWRSVGREVWSIPGRSLWKEEAAE